MKTFCPLFNHSSTHKNKNLVGKFLRHNYLQILKIILDWMLMFLVEWQCNYDCIFNFSQGHIRALALRVLREILKNQPSRFKDYTELTILRILEAHKDSEREVVRSAEECADTLANYLPPETCVRILNPIISTANYPVSLAAIKMQNKVGIIVNWHTVLPIHDWKMTCII